MQIHPLSEHIGAEIEGVDLARCKDSEFELVYDAFLRYQVIFLRNQHFSPEQHLALACRFGEIEPVHPFFPHLEKTPQVVVIETSPGNPPGESFWHTDLSWQKRPSKCSLLHAQHVPDKGGDTIWTSMSAVWESLPVAMKTLLRGKESIHALHAFEGSKYDQIDDLGQSRVNKMASRFPPVRHPVVVVHPETQRETLFINEQFTRGIAGMSVHESEAILAELFALAREVQFQHRFSWQPGSLAIWDNRSTQHYAVTDYGDSPRKLHRVSVQGGFY
ncbi:TauD/TfdA family dioxygenase [Parasalinivibrio latis]|uniref:TauD/TfdA dioxygenase family protein n=1 Tax=Parasalinivibrio latis TaxID=2952610 RepID=UPI0030E18206